VWGFLGKKLELSDFQHMFVFSVFVFVGWKRSGGARAKAATKRSLSLLQPDAG
jgi:hypothetical protein